MYLVLSAHVVYLMDKVLLKLPELALILVLLILPMIPLVQLMLLVVMDKM